MRKFFREYWANIWDGDALLGDRVKGIILALLVFGLLSALIGGLVHIFKGPANDADSEKKKAAAWEQSAVPAWLRSVGGFLFKLLEPFCEGLPISVGASVIFFLLLGLLGLDYGMRWAGAAAAIPALLVLLQYVYLWAHKPRQTSNGNDGPAARLQRQQPRAQLAIESSYGARTLFIRYGFPAILLLVEGLLLAFVLVNPEGFLRFPRWEIAYGARFGAMGAYAWVLIELGRRSFRRDVTTGAALWSIVTLALGPMLGAVIALVWKPTPKADNAWQLAIVYFYAGYAPRTVLSVMTSAAAQLLRIGPQPHVETRTTPLTKIRGINPQIEERLAEEGIDNVETLAAVEPIRLFRDTPFDLRNILWWIDEALLMMYVPQRWQLLEEQGITGAIDLADLAYQAAKEVSGTDEEEEEEEEDDKKGGSGGNGNGTSDDEDEAPLTAAPSAAEVLRDLARQANMRQPTFRSLANRILNDHQVAYVWLLYNAYVTDGDHRAKEEKAEAETEPHG